MAVSTDKQSDSADAIPEYSPRIGLITMGCAKNEADSYAMRNRLLAHGYTIEEDLEQADAIIVNTCSFIQTATEESLEMIFDILSLPSVANNNVPLIVCGCMPSRYGEDLENELFEVSSFVPCSLEDDIVSAVEHSLGNRFSKNTAKDANHTCESSSSLTDDLLEQDIYAYVKISEGCNRKCSYCTIPFIRGSYSSYTFEEIDRTVQEHIDSGAKEIVLVAQDSGFWGKDFDEPLTLSWLLDKLATLHGDTWFRVMYTQPEGITDDLLSVMSSHDNICNYLDIPIQHVSEKILKDMNRSGNRKTFEELVSRIRTAIPDIALRTTLIAGFPGETQEQFDDLCDFVSAGFFDYVGVFEYSREEGTDAFDFPDQIDDSEKRSRARQLRDIADAACTLLIRDRIGTTQAVIVQGYEEDGRLFGRAMSQAPDVDGVTYIKSGDIGEVVTVRICDTLGYEMEGE